MFNFCGNNEFDKAWKPCDNDSENPKMKLHNPAKIKKRERERKENVPLVCFNFDFFLVASSSSGVLGNGLFILWCDVTHDDDVEDEHDEDAGMPIAEPIDDDVFVDVNEYDVDELVE